MSESHLFPQERNPYLIISWGLHTYTILPNGINHALKTRVSDCIEWYSSITHPHQYTCAHLVSCLFLVGIVDCQLLHLTIISNLQHRICMICIRTFLLWSFHGKSELTYYFSLPFHFHMNLNWNFFLQFLTNSFTFSSSPSNSSSSVCHDLFLLTLCIHPFVSSPQSLQEWNISFNVKLLPFLWYGHQFLNDHKITTNTSTIINWTTHSPKHWKCSTFWRHYSTFERKKKCLQEKYFQKVTFPSPQTLCLVLEKAKETAS